VGEGASVQRRHLKNRDFAKVRLFPAQSLIAANSGHEIISRSCAKRPCRARRDIAEVGRVRVVPVDRG
jgi:hypothetical protein